MLFSQLYGLELTRELGSADVTKLFTTTRRKAAINAAQQEFVKRTECVIRRTTIPLVSSTQEYDIEATATDFWLISKQGISIKIVSGTNTRYIEGDDLLPTSIEELNHDEPGWRAVSPGTPTKYYVQPDGSATYLGFHPAPSITVGDTWTVLLPYVPVVADMSADADVPFSYSSNARIALVPYHRVLAHFAAADLEKLRKEPERILSQLQLWEVEIMRYQSEQRPKHGGHVRFAREYQRRRRGAERFDPRVEP